MSESAPTPSQILASHFAETFGSKSGQIVLKYLEKNFYVNQPAFIKNGPTAPYDVIEAGIRDGRRQVVEVIRNQIAEHTPKRDKKVQTKAKR